MCLCCLLADIVISFTQLNHNRWFAKLLMVLYGWLALSLTAAAGVVEQICGESWGIGMCGIRREMGGWVFKCFGWGRLW